MRLHRCDSLFQALLCLWRGEKHSGLKTLAVLGTLRLKSVQSAGVYACTPWSCGRMKPPPAEALSLLSREEPNTSQGGSIFGCRAAGIGLQAASC